MAEGISKGIQRKNRESPKRRGKGNQRKGYKRKNTEMEKEGKQRQVVKDGRREKRAEEGPTRVLSMF